MRHRVERDWWLCDWSIAFVRERTLCRGEGSSRSKEGCRRSCCEGLSSSWHLWARWVCQGSLSQQWLPYRSAHFQQPCLQWARVDCSGALRQYLLTRVPCVRAQAHHRLGLRFCLLTSRFPWLSLHRWSTSRSSLLARSSFHPPSRRPTWLFAWYLFLEQVDRTLLARCHPWTLSF